MYCKVCSSSLVILALVLVLVGTSFAGGCVLSKCVEMNSKGNSDPLDDCQPNDGLDDGQCFQDTFNNTLPNDMGFHIPSGEWNINTVAGNILFRTGLSNFSIFGDGNSSKMLFGGAVVMGLQGSEGYIGDFQIVKSTLAGSVSLDHILMVDNSNRVTINNIEFWLNSKAAALKVADGPGASNGILITNLRVVGGKGISATTKGVVLNLDLPSGPGFDVRVIGLIAPEGMSGLGAGESALYENGNSGGVWDFIDVNPPADAVLLDVVGATRQIYQRFLTAPGANTASLVRIKDSDALDFSHWQIPGNGTTSTAHIFQALAGATGIGCAGCSFSNIIFDDKNIANGPDYFNLTASPAVAVIDNIWRDSDNSVGSSVVELGAGSSKARVTGNIKQSGVESIDIQVVAGLTSVVIENNLDLGVTGTYQSEIGPFIVNPSEPGVVNSATVRLYSDDPLPGVMARDKTANVESYCGPADGDKVVCGSMTNHNFFLRGGNIGKWHIKPDGDLNTTQASVAGPNSYFLCYDLTAARVAVSDVPCP